MAFREEKNKLSIHYYQSGEYTDLSILYEDEDIRDTFNGFRADRIISSEYIFMIDLDDEPIGFILLVLENRNQLGLDMGIIKKYRNKGYGTEAMKLFKEAIKNKIDKELVAEVKKNNIGANKAIINGGFEFYKTKNENVNVYKYVKI